MNEISAFKKPRSFWETTTGIITKITALITAITGLILAINKFNSTTGNQTNYNTPNAEGNSETLVKEYPESQNTNDVNYKQLILGAWTTNSLESDTDENLNEDKLTYSTKTEGTINYNVDGHSDGKSNIFWRINNSQSGEIEEVAIKVSYTGSWRITNGKIIETLNNIEIKPLNESAIILQRDFPKNWTYLIKTIKDLEGTSETSNILSIDENHMTLEEIKKKEITVYMRK